MGERVELTAAIEPSNILWENLSFSKRRVFLRKMAIILLSFLVLYSTLIGFTLAKANITQKYMTNVDSGKCTYVDNLFEDNQSYK